ncbi:MAG: hypothetical protein M1488_08340 [Gammaproteobacteria bacterium]|nr:hypothetical protein [Gammaproteobacteria bacterium]
MDQPGRQATERAIVTALSALLREERDWLARVSFADSSPFDERRNALIVALQEYARGRSAAPADAQLREAVLALQEEYFALDHALRVASGGLREALALLQAQKPSIYGGSAGAGRSLGRV